jgi:hypothetical protein
MQSSAISQSRGDAVGGESDNLAHVGEVAGLRVQSKRTEHGRECQS